MVDEASENVGGIDVTIGASHAQLPGDLEAADRIFEQYRAKWQEGANVPIRAQAVQTQSPISQPARQAAVRPAISVGPGSATRAQGQQAQTALTQAINAKLAATGETYNPQTGEIEKATTALQRQRQAVVAIQAEASRSTDLAIDTKDIQASLNAVLATMREIATEAERISQVRVNPNPTPAGQQAVAPRTTAPKVPARQTVALPPAPRAAATVTQPAPVAEPTITAAPSRPAVTSRPVVVPVTEEPEERPEVPRPARRKNITPRDIGTSADVGRVYTFDPEVYAEQDRMVEARSARQRELALASNVARQERAAARPRGALTDSQRRAANNLNALNASQSVTLTPIQSSTATVTAPGYRSNEQIERSRQASSNVTPQQRAAQVQAALRAEAQQALRARREAFDQSQAQATAQAFTESRRVRQFQIDEEQQARVVTSRRAAITGSGRTSRTLASGLGALFGGTEQRQIEAQAAAQQATRQLVSAEKAIAPLDDRLRGLARTWATASGETRKFVAEQFRAIRGSDEYRGALVNVQKAVEDDAKAQADLNKISGASSVARNLVAITTAGVAFGAGLKVVDTVLGAIGPALGNFLDIQSGFGATSTRVTSALGQQTLALHGNVDAVLAAADAQAGLSTAASGALNNQLRLTTQIKAGAQAQQQASDLFRAGAGAGNAPSGLFGGYGGVGGTGFLAQQLGGGRGFSETIQQDLGALQGRGGPDILGNINQGLAYLGNQGVRDFVNKQAQQQSNIPVQVAGGLAGVPGQIANTAYGLPGGVANTLSALNPFGKNFLNPIANSETGLTVDPRQALASQAGLTAGTQVQPLQINDQGVAYLKNLNDAASRGAEVLGSASRATIKFTNDANEIATATQAAAQAGDAYGVTLAQQQHIVVALGDAVADSGDKYRQALEQFSTGVGIADPNQLARANLANERQRQRESAANLPTIEAQQAFERPSQINLLARQTGFAIGTQQPAQAALGALANPNVPVGTGIAAADQKALNGRLKETQGLQDQLNAYYKQGQDVIENTYRPAIVQNFGQAAGQAFDAALTAVKQTGAQIAQVQAGISNEQAAYQVAQYNFQLLIAKRNLSDIGGLTGKNFGAGESYLGVLERQNLALSRQGQLLQFGLSQRQINFQTALAGFQAPGVTPEERQARIAEAKIEAGYAQKQLDIQRQMFGNQVQIVDISNLRQGRDLARQIALLTQGRRVTLDTTAAEQRLLRLQQIQARNVAQVSTYLSAVDNLAATAFGQIQQLEAAAGHALTVVGRAVLSQFSIVLSGMTSQLSNLNAVGGQSSQDNSPDDRNVKHAAGGVFTTSGMTHLTNQDVVGDAGNETVAILAHPRAASGFGGGGNIYIDIHGNTVRNDSDLNEIVSEVTKRLGREASLKGLRGIS